MASFSLLSSFFHLFLSISLNAEWWNPFLSSHSRLLKENKVFGTTATRAGELRLTLEVTGLPKQAGSFRLKFFEGPGESKDILGEPGTRKLNKKTILPLPFGIFCILDQNIERFLVLCRNWC